MPKYPTPIYQTLTDLVFKLTYNKNRQSGPILGLWNNFGSSFQARIWILKYCVQFLDAKPNLIVQFFDAILKMGSSDNSPIQLNLILFDKYAD